MRREEASQGVRVNHQGELIKDGSPLSNEDYGARHRLRDENECEWELILGDAGAAGCATNESTVWEEELCELKCEAKPGCEYKVLEAAAGRTIEDLQDASPDGCFVKEENGAVNTNKYFYNPRGAREPSTVHNPREGTPLCKRPKYMHGTAVASAEADCPGQYKVISLEKPCEIAADCWGDTVPAADVIGDNDHSQHDFFPQGCFIHATETGSNGEQKAYFNPPRAGMGLPSNPVGTPICVYCGTDCD